MHQWRGLTEDGNQLILQNLLSCRPEIPQHVDESWLCANGDRLQTGLVLDVETTGLNWQKDDIIEIAIREFQFCPRGGHLVRVLGSYTALEDPGREIPPFVMGLTGITNEMVQGKKIDWNLVQEMMDRASIVIAHNASFDRPFIEKRLPLKSETCRWACSLSQIEWSTKGLPSAKLELLALYHGFFIPNSHRALNDVDALLLLLSKTCQTRQQAYFFEIFENSMKPRVKIIAEKSPFDRKDALKARRYAWDNLNRVWFKVLPEDQVAAEIQWLEEQVYFAQGGFPGSLVKIPIAQNFLNHD